MVFFFFRTDVKLVGGFLVGYGAADEPVFVLVPKSLYEFHKNIHV